MSDIKNSRLSYVKYLNEALREDVAARESELKDYRNSLRYLAGGIVLEAFPPSLRSFKALVKLVRLYHSRRRSPQSTISRKVKPELTHEALCMDTVILGSVSPFECTDSESWVCEDADLVAQRLDVGHAGTLILRKPASVVARRLARAKQNGWRIIWCPEHDVSDCDPALVGYVMAQADECREGVPA